MVFLFYVLELDFYVELSPEVEIVDVEATEHEGGACDCQCDQSHGGCGISLNKAQTQHPHSASSQTCVSSHSLDIMILGNPRALQCEKKTNGWMV